MTPCIAPPLLIGFAAGLSMAFVGVAFPLMLSSIIATGGLGCMGSPVHLCLNLSAELFKARPGDVQRLMIPPLITVIAALCSPMYSCGPLRTHCVPAFFPATNCGICFTLPLSGQSTIIVQLSPRWTQAMPAKNRVEQTPLIRSVASPSVQGTEAESLS